MQDSDLNININFCGADLGNMESMKELINQVKGGIDGIARILPRPPDLPDDSLEQ